MLALGGDLRFDASAGADLVLLNEVFHGEVHARQVASRNRQIAGHHGTRCNDDGVVAGTQVIPGDVHTDIDVGTEPSALGRHLCQTQLQVLLFHFEVGDAVTQQSADAVVTLEHGNGVPGTRQLLGSGQSSRAGTNDRDGFTGQTSGRLRLHPSLGERLVDD